jgi:FixJ family two-component response regulator
METSVPLVFVVDDDSDMREALCALLASPELRVVACASASEYLEMPKPDVAACLILDVSLPDMSGVELQQRLGIEGHPPIIFLTATIDIPTSVRAVR